MLLRSGTLNSETAEMGVPKYLGWLVLASVETRWNVMGAWPPSHMQSLIFARICLNDELGMWPLNLLTKVMYLTSESLASLHTHFGLRTRDFKTCPSALLS